MNHNIAWTLTILAARYRLVTTHGTLAEAEAAVRAFAAEIPSAWIDTRIDILDVIERLEETGIEVTIESHPLPAGAPALPTI